MPTVPWVWGGAETDEEGRLGVPATTGACPLEAAGPPRRSSSRRVSCPRPSPGDALRASATPDLFCGVTRGAWGPSEPLDREGTERTVCPDGRSDEDVVERLRAISRFSSSFRLEAELPVVPVVAPALGAGVRL